MSDKQEQFLNDLRIKLAVSNECCKGVPGSVLNYQVICDHDAGFFCEHRLEWLINEIKNNL